MGTLLRHGSERQRESWLPPIASGELRLQAFGVTEPGAGSDTTAIQTRAQRTPDGYRVNGQKVWTSRAAHSDLMVLLARTTAVEELEWRTDGLSLFLVDMRGRGGELEMRPIATMINHATTEVFFNDLELPADALIGEEGRGFRYVLDGMNAERILIAAECVGDGRFFVRARRALRRRAGRLRAPDRRQPGRAVPDRPRPHGDRGGEPDALEGVHRLHGRAALRRRGEHGEVPRLGGLLAGRKRVS
jgi:acyl-CoA dehydrogenase